MPINSENLFLPQARGDRLARLARGQVPGDRVSMRPVMHQMPLDPGSERRAQVPIGPAYMSLAERRQRYSSRGARSAGAFLP